jgi:hypothetical protein
MDPLAIIYPDPRNADMEVRKAIMYALDNHCAIAVRSGGHQYSGASSTFGNNIQLDVSDAYLTFELLSNINDINIRRPLVRVGVGFPLVVLNEKLGELGLFVPHGQCSHVHVGGHAHTGGYGQLGRAFGLFADHIKTIEVWTAKDVDKDRENAKPRVISRNSGSQADRDLFYAVLGGSPGNYGILTHVTLETRRDSDYPDSRGLKLVVMYSKEVRPYLPCTWVRRGYGCRLDQACWFPLLDGRCWVGCWISRRTWQATPSSAVTMTSVSRSWTGQPSCSVISTTPRTRGCRPTSRRNMAKMRWYVY